MTEATPPPVPTTPVAPPITPQASAASEVPPAPLPEPAEPTRPDAKVSPPSRRTILLAAAIVGGPLALVNAAGFATLAHQHADQAHQKDLRGAASVRNGASRFLNDIQDRDWDGAHARLCTTAKRRTNRSNFVAGLDYRNLQSHRILRSDADMVSGLETASVVTELSWSDGADTSSFTTNETKMTLRLEGGQWRVCTGPF